MKTTQAGQLAEARVAQKLQADGYKILARNWRTPVCEIDLVAKKGGVVYFTEVKYRRSSAAGSGWDYIGPAKLKRMIFAGRVWCQYHRFSGDWRLLAAEASGERDKINLVEIDYEL